MKKTVIFFVSILISGMVIAQDNTDIVEKGTVLTLGPVSASGYQHVEFPRKNIIIKRGAIANFSSLEGAKVVVTEVRSENGITEVILKRKDGHNFFRFWPSISADIEKALVKGELKKPAMNRQDSIAQK